MEYGDDILPIYIYVVHCRILSKECPIVLVWIPVDFFLL